MEFNYKQVVLVVLDGWGYREDPQDNAISAADTSFFDSLWQEYPHTLLKAHGDAVGLPDNQIGNSEVGHTTIGAGSIVDTDLVRINKAIDDESFYQNAVITEVVNTAKKRGSNLHLFGILGDGGVHGHSKHLVAMLEAAKHAGLKNVFLHLLTDGRDAPPQSAAGYLEELQFEINKIGIGEVASITGRFYSMDRDTNWDRTQRGMDAIFAAQGEACQQDPVSYLKELYQEEKLDEHLEPIVCQTSFGLGAPVSTGDVLFCHNFRADRVRQISKLILEKSKSMDLYYATMTSYGKDYQCPIAFEPQKIDTTIAKEVSAAGLTQAHIAETEKFPHATYFLNGGVEKPYPGEEQIVLASRKDVPTHDLAPKMRAEAIADQVVEQIQKNVNFIFINFANPDMVGHTANVPAIIEAVEEVDRQLKRVVKAVLENDGVLFVTADHGNAELNVDSETGEKHTAHTTNPVPAIITIKDLELISGGGLSQIAPTIINLLGLTKVSSLHAKGLISS